MKKSGTIAILPFFEMLGNWSLGDYFKEEQLIGFFSFLVEELKISPARLYVFCL